MERAMSIEDKIRRAEERYYKRRIQNDIVKDITIKTTKKKRDIRLLRKMIKQIICCLIIYGIFYSIINNNYIFSADFTEKTKEILSNDINFLQIYGVVSNKLEKIYNRMIQYSNSDNKSDDQNNEILKNDDNIDDINTEGEEKILETVDDNENNEENQEISQMENDAIFIKETISFVKPVNGKISSEFGLRNPTTETVPKNHTGTDISAETGTKIISATDGTVILTSSKGDYGKHLNIQINDVIIVYAHCNKLYVNEGDIIKQGQEIAEVGSTGNTTGPHLHFEVRYQNRYVNPQLILEL